MLGTDLLVVDIETCPVLASLDAAYPGGSVPSNYKDPEKIAAWLANDEAQWRANRAKTCSLSPRLGRVVAIGYASAEKPGGWATVAPVEADEPIILADLWSRLVGNRPVCGFNSIAFDFPFLLIRSLITGVEVPNIDRYLRRYQHTPHFDLRMALSMWDSRAEGTLDDWLAAFGLPGKTGDGSKVWPMVQAEDFDALERYAASDAALTYRLAAKIAPAFGVA